jgi:hypothetical protein
MNNKFILTEGFFKDKPHHIQIREFDTLANMFRPITHKTLDIINDELKVVDLSHSVDDDLDVDYPKDKHNIQVKNYVGMWGWVSSSAGSISFNFYCRRNIDNNSVYDITLADVFSVGISKNKNRRYKMESKRFSKLRSKNDIIKLWQKKNLINTFKIVGRLVIT